MVSLVLVGASLALVGTLLVLSGASLALAPTYLRVPNRAHNLGLVQRSPLRRA